MNNNYYRDYFFKNFLTLLIPMLIPLIVMGALSIVIIQQYVKESINDESTNLLKQTREHLELILNELDSLNLYIIASASEFENLQKVMNKSILNTEDHKELAALKNFIDSPNIARPYIDSIYIYVANQNGKFISSTAGGLTELEEFDDTYWFNSFQRHAASDELTWAEARTISKQIFNEPSDKVDLITMFRKIPHMDGVIVLNIKTEYIEEQLNTLSKTAGLGLFIVDEENKVLFNEERFSLKKSDIADIMKKQEDVFSKVINRDSFIVSKITSEKYNWTYFSVSPKSSIYEVPIRLIKIALVLLVACIGGSVLLALYLTNITSRNVKTIVAIFEAAEADKPLPPLPRQVRDIYSYIVHSILINYRETNILKVHVAEKKYKEQAMEYMALHSQLNPHFLFNTLETINWKAIALTGSPNELNAMIENLAVILRYSLDEETRLVPISEEIKYTMHYIEIQKIRYHNEFTLQWELDDTIRHYQVKKLILQPLIENALQHGLTSERPFKMKIKLINLPKSIEIRVIDNGHGMSKSRLAEVRARLETNNDHLKHIGLLNTHRRLKVAYGQQYGLIVQSKEGWGTVIILTIPK
ncbi:sensor histidine kinase [Solibacillus sp. FSL H8-0538]|uniref:sensor histidine kinase n=1 Tax=Solibacillus sp. FSL H8-0538 TaxID=2921400 RepID=UPI0030F4D2C9